jgi:hypothetical protein
MNSVAAKPSQLGTETAVQAFMDQTRSLFGGMKDLWSWGCATVLRNIVALGLDAEHDIRLDSYLEAARGSSLSSASAFAALANAARGGGSVPGQG